MRSSHNLAGIQTTFDENNLVPNAGLLVPAALAQKLGVAELVDEHVELPDDAAGRASCGTKAMTVIGAMLAGADSIDDIDVLRAGAAAELFDQVRAPSTIGTPRPTVRQAVTDPIITPSPGPKGPTRQAAFDRSETGARHGQDPSTGNTDATPTGAAPHERRQRAQRWIEAKDRRARRAFEREDPRGCGLRAAGRDGFDGSKRHDPDGRVAGRVTKTGVTGPPGDPTDICGIKVEG